MNVPSRAVAVIVATLLLVASYLTASVTTGSAAEAQPAQLACSEVCWTAPPLYLARYDVTRYGVVR